MLRHEVGSLVGSPCFVARGAGVLLALSCWLVHTRDLSGQMRLSAGPIGSSFDGGPEADNLGIYLNDRQVTGLET